MNEFIVLITIIFISVLGYAVIRGFHLLPAKENLLALGCSYGLGVGLVTLQLYIYSRLQIPWHIIILLFPWLIIIIGIIIKSKKKVSLHNPNLIKLKTIDQLLLIGILLSFMYVVFEALIRPVAVWDAWAIWLLKSKIFFIDGKINPDILNYVRSDYPLMFSLLGTLIYLVLGRINDTAVLLTSVAFYFFLGLSMFSALKNKYGIKYALFFTFLYGTIQNFIRHGGRMEAGQADLPLGYYTFICTILLMEYLKKSDGKVLLLLSIFLGITSLVKFEGIPIAFVIASFIIYHVLKKKLYRHLLLLFIWFVLLLDWQVYKKIHHLTHDYFASHSLTLNSSKAINAVVGTFKELVNIKSWNFLWLSYIYTLFSLKLANNNSLFILNVIILSQLLLYLLLYIFTLGNEPGSSVERLLVHLAPLVLYYMSIVTKRYA